MKILFLTPRLPYPPYRGDKLKVWNLISQLSRKHEIVLVTFIQQKSERQLISNVKENCASVHTVYKPSWRSFLSCIKAIPSSKPFQVAYFESRAMKRLIERLVDDIKPDIIHTHLIRMAQFAAPLGGSAKVLDMTDAVSLYLGRFRDAQKNPLLRWVIGTEFKRMIGYEKIIDRFDNSLVCSWTDQAFLKQRLPDAHIGILENGIDLGTFVSNDSVRFEPHRIIFTGNLGYYPNADAASHFVKEILPLVRKSIPEARLYIVGQNPPRHIRKLANENVVVTGFVENIRDEYLKSAVAISPVRFGAGTLNKVLEPLALGIPIVATSMGTQGLKLDNGSDILIADDPVAFAGAVCRILRDTKFRDQIANSARSRVRAEWGWENVAARLQRIYADALREDIPRPGRPT